MRGQRLSTFATKDDWSDILKSFELHASVKYVRSGMSEGSQRKEYLTFAELPDFGIAQTGDAIQEPRYLIARRDSALFSESVAQKKGGIRYEMDHSNNPDSVIFSPGGVNFAARAIISGEISKLSRAQGAEELFGVLSKL